MKRGAGRILINGVEIDLVDDDVSAYAASDRSNLAERSVRSQNTAGIVQIADDDQLGLRADGLPDRAWINRVAIALLSRKTSYSDVEILRGGSEQFIGGMFDQDFVAGLQQRCHCEMVRHRGSRSRHDTARI